MVDEPINAVIHEQEDVFASEGPAIVDQPIPDPANPFLNTASEAWDTLRECSHPTGLNPEVFTKARDVERVVVPDSVSLEEHVAEGT